MSELDQLAYGPQDDEIQTRGNTQINPGAGDNDVYIGGTNNEVIASDGNNTVFVQASAHNGYDTQVTVTDFDHGDELVIRDESLVPVNNGNYEIVEDVSNILKNAGVSVSSSCDLEGTVGVQANLISVACAEEVVASR